MCSANSRNMIIDSLIVGSTALQSCRSFSFNSTVKQTVGKFVICKNIHTTFNVLCFTPGLSKIHIDCSYPIISLWISTNQSRLYSFSCRHGNWLCCGVTVWNLAGKTHKSAFSSELEKDRVPKQLQHQKPNPSQFTPCVQVCAYSSREF